MTRSSPGRSRGHHETQPNVIRSLTDAADSAWRCWTWRGRHGCGCVTADDCMLHTPLPVHSPQPCPGLFGDGGRWQEHCRGAA